MGRRLVVTSIAVLALAVVAGCAPAVPTSPPPGATGASAGCGTTTQGGVTEWTETVEVDGRLRRYVITVPPNHVPGTSEPIPLVFDFHGLIEGMVSTHPFATQFSAKANDEGFAAVFPVGSNDGFNWDVSLDEDNPDLRFIDALRTELEDTMCIDRSRVYATGLSYGAFMTSMLMCMRPNHFAAAAPVAGVRNFCTATERNVPVLTFHGTADWILPYPLFASTPAEIAAKYGCASPPSDTTLAPDPDPTTGGTITRTSWNCGEVGSAVESYRIEGGGHSWPGSFFFQLVGFIVGPTATSIDATELIWEFFERHQL
jgi:polyhydroxybutyrate depolymerase